MHPDTETQNEQQTQGLDYVFHTYSCLSAEPPHAPRGLQCADATNLLSTGISILADCDEPDSIPTGPHAGGIISSHSSHFRSLPTRRLSSLELSRRPQAARVLPKQRHAVMGLLKCARCGCAMTAER